jgi:hypothetical protein
MLEFFMIAKLGRCRGAVALAHVARQADIRFYERRIVGRRPAQWRKRFAHFYFSQEFPS